MIAFLFSILCYICGIGSLAAFFIYIQFYIDLTGATPTGIVLCKDILVFMIFPLQHTLLARSGIKQWIARRLKLMERPLYVGTSGIAMAAVLYWWQPFGPMLMQIKTRLPFDLVMVAALALILWTTKQLDHGRLFGLKQGFAAWKGYTLTEGGLKTDGVFGVVRHPLTSLLLVVLWSHHTMTAGRLLFNVLFTAYSLAGTLFEERDLVKKFGQQYLDYRKQVPAFIPFSSVRALRESGKG